ncbi:MAG: N-acetylmuramoyl-L-alanine amidase [Patescibacteria group bacterium]|nr:N-acetylmuramoyl-L-alanine amidase [Patescibacteria group bacterium]
MLNKNYLLLVFLFPLLFGVLVGILLIDPVVANPSETKVGQITLNESNTASAFSNTENLLISIPENKLEEVIEKEEKADFKFNAVGLQYEGNVPENSNLEFYLQVEDGEWQLMPMMEPATEQGEELKATDLLFENGESLKYKIVLRRNSTSDKSPVISNVKVTYLNTTFGPKGERSSALGQRSAQSSKFVISREDWGADESYRFWGPEYAEPKKFVIHHTAGGNGGDDPAATMRAIYYWHAVALGWGDVGYNYLLDSEGNVYEGRYGGNNVIGAHVYNEVKNINYNKGTIGISIMGCYDDNNCPTLNKFNKKIKNSLTTLIAKKSKALNIKPKGQSVLFDVKTPNIVGHKDLDYTTCPGNRIYKKMKRIRIQAKKKYSNNTYAWRGKMEDNTIRTAYLGDWKQEVTVSYKNTGTRTWKKEKTYLKVYNDDKEDVSKFKNRSWKDKYGKFEFNEKSVPPGETATFTFTINTPKKPDLYNNIFKVFINKSPINKSKTMVTTRVDKTPK